MIAQLHSAQYIFVDFKYSRILILPSSLNKQKLQNNDQFEFQEPLVGMIGQMHFAHYIFVDFKLFQNNNLTKFIDQGNLPKQVT
jgi:hypothetical protein